MENCSSNPLLNAAFKEMNNNNHEWIQNIKYLLYKLGMGNLWEHKNTEYIHTEKYGRGADRDCEHMQRKRRIEETRIPNVG